MHLNSFKPLYGSDDMKRANHGTHLKGSTQPQTPPVEAPQTGKNPADARERPEQLKKNQADLGVAEDHKTDDMEEGSRGTFP